MTIEAGIESAGAYIDSLDDTYPASGDDLVEGDNHIRGVKNCLLNTFPVVTGPINATHTEINSTCDGSTTVSAPTLVATDQVPVNDGGTMIQVALSTMAAFFRSVTETLSNKTIAAATFTGTQLGFIGNVTGDLTGNADTATTCTTIPTLSGDVSNSGNVITLVDTIAGNRVLIESQTATASPTLDFTTSIDSTYDAYEFEIINLLPATDDVSVIVRVRNVSTWRTSGYLGGVATTGVYLNTSGTTAGIDNVNTSGFCGIIHAIEPDNASKVTTILIKSGTYPNAAGGWANNTSVFAGGCYNTAEVNNGIRFLMSSGNITSGTINLYGIKKG